MEYFDDQLQIHDDLNDLLDLETDELNRYFLEGHLETIINEEEEMTEDDPLNKPNHLKVKLFL